RGEFHPQLAGRTSHVPRPGPGAAWLLVLGRGHIFFVKRPAELVSGSADLPPPIAGLFLKVNEVSLFPFTRRRLRKWLVVLGSCGCAAFWWAGLIPLPMRADDPAEKPAAGTDTSAADHTQRQAAADQFIRVVKSTDGTITALDTSISRYEGSI